MGDSKRSALLIGVAIVFLVAAGISIAWMMGGNEESPAAMEFQRARATPEEARAQEVGSGPTDSDASASARLGSQEPEIQPEEPPTGPSGNSNPRRPATRGRNRSAKPAESEAEPLQDGNGGARQKPPMG